MSVDAEVYLGVYLDILNKVDVYDEKFNPFMEKRENERFSMIYDGMCGNYCYFGITIASIVDIFDYNNKIIDSDYIERYACDVEDKLRELGVEVYEKPKLVFFSHSH